MDKPCVLVADDSDAISTLLKAVLQRDYEVELAGCGREVLERLRTRDYAAVVLDLLMPEIDGFGVLDFVGQERPEMLGKVIVLTAAVTPRDVERVATYPVFSVLRKPFEIEILYDNVRRCAGAGEMPQSGGGLLTSGMLLLLAEVFGSR